MTVEVRKRLEAMHGVLESAMVSLDALRLSVYDENLDGAGLTIPTEYTYLLDASESLEDALFFIEDALNFREHVKDYFPLSSGGESL